jgi:hydrogenase expression/formation protein HypE
MPPVDDASKVAEPAPPEAVPASPIFGSCPLPIFAHQQIVLGHGSGGKLTSDLIEKIFLPAFRNPTLDKLDDQATLCIGGARLAFTTDSFVVTPIFFPGGDIGKLAICGTVNDLAMSGARPLCLSAAFILEKACRLRIFAASSSRCAQPPPRQGSNSSPATPRW